MKPSAATQQILQKKRPAKKAITLGHSAPALRPPCALPDIALIEPAISSCCVELYISTSIRPFRIVSLTLAPSRTEPTVSKMLARMQACRRVTTPEPTAVPKELATSFAPTEKARTKAMMKPRTSIQRKSAMGAVSTAGVSSMAGAGRWVNKLGNKLNRGIAIGLGETATSYGPVGRRGWGPGAAPWSAPLVILRERQS